MHFIQQTKAFLLIDCARVCLCVCEYGTCYFVLLLLKYIPLSIGVAWSLRLNYDPLLRFAYLTAMSILWHVAKKKEEENNCSHPWRDYLNWLHIEYSINIDHCTRAFFATYSIRRSRTHCTIMHIHSLSLALSFASLYGLFTTTIPTISKRFTKEDFERNSTRTLKI